MRDRMRTYTAALVLLPLMFSIVPSVALAVAVPLAGQPADGPRIRLGHAEQVTMLLDPTDIPLDPHDASAPAGERPRFVTVDVPEGRDAEEYAAELVARGRARQAAPTSRISIQSPPDDPHYSSEALSGITQRAYLGGGDIAPHGVDLESLWDLTGGDADGGTIKIAVLDTGYTAPGEEHNPAVRPMWDYVGADASPTDDNGHGTAVVSVIAALADNGTGIAGAVRGARVEVLVYKIMDRYGAGSGGAALQAVTDAADDGADIINCSFGETDAGSGSAALWDAAVAYAWERGALVFAAAGNGGSDRVGDPEVVHPAASPHAIAVGSIGHDPDLSTRPTGMRSPFSNYGPDLDLVAPGEGILLAQQSTGSVLTGNGTSFATPVAAGAAAYVWSAAPGATSEELVDALLTGAHPYPGASDPDILHYGHGRIDALGAYDALEGVLIADGPVAVRLAGADRYGTAAVVSRRGHAGGADVVLLANGEDFPDALAAGPLAHAVDAPLLLTRHDSLPPATANELDRLSPDHLMVIGGPGAVSDAVLAEAARAAGCDAERIAGSDRYDTAARVAARLALESPAGGGPVLLASGVDFPDALAAVPYAAAIGRPVLLVRPDGVPPATRAALSALDATSAVVVGGPGAVSEGCVREAAALLPVERVWGLDRYRTAQALADRARRDGVLRGGAIGLATGRSFPDALAGGPYMASAEGPLILVDEPDPTLDDWLRAEAGDMAEIGIFGGEAVVSPRVETRVTSVLARAY